MQAHAGDWLVVESATVGHARREGRIRTVWGVDGSPPYEVEWLDTGKITLCFPGPDARVTPHGEHTTRAAARR